MDSLSDQQLLRDYVKRRSEAAFTELVRRHVDLVYSATLRMVRDPHLAEDVAQGVFVALAQNARTLTDRSVLSGWLHRTAQNLAANVVRSDVRRRAREQEAAVMNELLAAESAASWEQIAPHLDAALGELSEADRDAVLLRYFERKSAHEMAQILGVSDDAAQKRVSRAVERLREFFARRGVSVGAGGLAVLIAANAVQSAPAGLAAAISAAAALAGASLATTATATATQAIAMTTLQKSLIIVTLVAASVAIPLVIQHRDQVKLRQSNQFLRQQMDQLSQLRIENERLSNLVAEAKSPQQLANDQFNELLRLRGEVGVLRQEISEMRKQKPANTQTLTSASETSRPPMVAFGTELSDMGATTPERAVTSLIWAAGMGDLGRVSELLELPKNVSVEDAPKHYEFFTKQLSNTFSDMEFTSIQGIRQNPDGTLRLNLVHRNIDTGMTNPFPFMLRLHDSGWKVVVEGDAPATLPP